MLARQPFYAEAGGQVSDRGWICGQGWRVEVQEVLQPLEGLQLLRGEVLEGRAQAGAARAIVDAERRAAITRNHTATHLLHAALREVLGTHVQQRGSLVAPERLRFDFTHGERVGDDSLRTVEALVSRQILANGAVRAAESSLEEARRAGAMALFGEKYSERVRTIAIARAAANGERFSYELCGGLHVGSTAEIGPFALISEGSVSAGIRRVEALTGAAAHRHFAQSRRLLGEAASALGASGERLPERIQALQDELARRKRRNAELERALAHQQFAARLSGLETIGEISALLAQLPDTPLATLREMADWFRAREGSGVLVLGSAQDGRAQLLAAVSDDLIARGLHAGQLIRAIAPSVGGGGGGRPNLAQAGGRDSAGIPQALAEARDYLANFALNTTAG